jgi:ribonucleoside-diphosphate reductase alpha chain
MAHLTGTLWDGLALRRLRASADPDSTLRPVALPAAWANAEESAAALASIAPGSGPVALPRLAERWIRRLEKTGRSMGLVTDHGFAEALRALLLTRRGAPGLATWRGETSAEPPRFILNLTAFLDAAGDFDATAYAEAVATATLAAEIAGEGRAANLAIGFADLAGFLAAHGLRYAGAEGREAAAALAALTLGAAEAESGRIADILGAREPLRLVWPKLPTATAIPGLAEAARRAIDSAVDSRGLRHATILALTPPDSIDALLGVETGGMAPPAGHIRPALGANGLLRDQPTRASRLAGPNAEALLAPVAPHARHAMLLAVGPFLHAAPPVAIASPAPPAPRPAQMAPPLPELPMLLIPRNAVREAVARVTIAGQRITLRMQEDNDGALRGIAFSLTRDSGLRALLDTTALSVSIGLARGVPLADYVDALAYAQFAPSGDVEGDPDIAYANSALDWAIRHVARAYLGRGELADPRPPQSLAAFPPPPPLLPLDLPATDARRTRRLRRVA